MTIQSGAYSIVNPSFIEPEYLVQYNQASGYTDTLAEGKPRVRLEEDDLLVYMKTMNVRTKMAAAQSSMNELPGVDIFTGMISTLTYLFKVRSIYDHHDVRAANNWGYSAVEAYRLGMRMGNFQLLRDAGLHGMNPQAGEGLLNAPGLNAINLPPDSFGNDTVVTYDNGQMAFFLAQQVKLIKTATLQLGRGKKFCILGPQRTLGNFEYNVVQLVQYQRPGAGTASTVETLKAILMANGDEVIWAYDDTLIGQGYGGADAVLIVMPELEKPVGQRGGINTNEFGDNMMPANKVMTTQYVDMAAPREIMSPMAGGKTDFMMEWRGTSGWAPRVQGITLVSMVYQ